MIEAATNLGYFSIFVFLPDSESEFDLPFLLSVNCSNFTSTLLLLVAGLSNNAKKHWIFDEAPLSDYWFLSFFATIDFEQTLSRDIFLRSPIAKPTMLLMVVVQNSLQLWHTHTRTHTHTHVDYTSSQSNWKTVGSSVSGNITAASQ